MNKKYILYILVVLVIITNSSYAFPKPLGRRANMVPISKTIDIPPEKRISNITASFADDPNNFSAIGRLSFTRALDGKTGYCTATVIKTDNGNMALTAAHCLWDILSNQWNTNIIFYPGYNNGQGTIGEVTAYTYTIWKNFEVDETLYDYGFIKFYYQDGRKLQDDAGAFDVEFSVPGGNYPVTVFGYPTSGEMPDCPKDGEHLCSWQGNTFDFDPSLPNNEWHRGIPIDVGDGSSGGPWIRDYDRNTNTGVIDGVSHGMLPPPYPEQGTTTWKWQFDDFSELLKSAEDFNPPSRNL